MSIICKATRQNLKHWENLATTRWKDMIDWHQHTGKVGKPQCAMQKKQTEYRSNAVGNGRRFCKQITTSFKTLQTQTCGTSHCTLFLNEVEEQLSISIQATAMGCSWHATMVPSMGFHTNTNESSEAEATKLPSTENLRFKRAYGKGWDFIRCKKHGA